ncbi:outer membrane protein assembly factor BamC [Solimicrobium silvestre]|uniref:Putative lipoprotein n=1 Tax=Solimicrobium silvestre TaxID=2099400 RepID=A0A2S9GSJ5_9BURK|nr:outer membrane protein assembly factor BamC [Solimicrobium silvestre]PRC90687.1 putative lipoprotein [Solimicrobium silvestre]
MTMRNNSRNNSLSKMVSMLAVVAIAGCSSTGNFLQPDRIDYKSASKKDAVAPTLDVPPDLSQISRDNRFSIPDNGSTGPLTASSFNAKSSGAATQQTVAAPVTTAINTLEDMRIERDGSQRWLLVKQSPEVLWPKIKDFWQENGFLINQDSQTTGVMETDWAENRAKIPEDFLRKTIGYVFDSLYSTGERDKFRTRLERRDDGSTEIYISHRGVEEVLIGAQKDTTTWAARPNDPALEAAFLTRLMVSLGATQEKAKEIVATTVNQPIKAKLVKDGAASLINVDESFDRAWRRVGLALDRVGFTVEDRDRAKGIYFVRYVDPDGDSNKDGFFSRIFSFGDKEKDAKRYRITVKGEANVTHVAVQNNDGGAENSAASDKILNLLLEQLK